jgi:hypothetical protein
MIKSLLILILLVISCGGAYLSKPSEQSFRDMIHNKMEKGDSKDGLVQLILRGGKGRADSFLDSCKYQDHVLWATVEREGKKIYTGAFSTWFANDLPIPAMEKKG